MLHAGLVPHEGGDVAEEVDEEGGAVLVREEKGAPDRTQEDDALHSLGGGWGIADGVKVDQKVEGLWVLDGGPPRARHLYSPHVLAARTSVG